MNKLSLRWLFILGFLLVSACSNRGTPAKLYPLPAFEFQNQDAIVVNNDSMRGKVWIASFFFASCPTVCPTLMRETQQMREAENWPKDTEVVSITVDPEVDTPSVLKTYGKTYNAEVKSGWQLLTGDVSTFKKTIKEGFKVAVGEKEVAEKGYDILHSTHYVLVDKDGTIRGYYESNELGRKLLIKAINAL